MINLYTITIKDEDEPDGVAFIYNSSLPSLIETLIEYNHKPLYGIVHKWSPGFNEYFLDIIHCSKIEEMIEKREGETKCI